MRIRRETAGAPARRVGADDAEYPVHLGGVANAPEWLWVCGELRSDDALAVAVVGARRATAYGLAVAEALGADLAARGVTVVSGLARGIDTAAHRGALRAGGRTIAVLGSGVDVIYPPENRGLAARIEMSGAVVSTFEPGTPALPYHFPLRNRIIAGLGLGVVVVEAAERSGALITAGLAGDLGREVMAVPGRVDSELSRGCHALLRDGAALVEGAGDVIAQLPERWRACAGEASPTPGPSGTEDGVLPALAAGPVDDARSVIAAIGGEPSTMDDVIERSGLASGRVAALLLELELTGHVRQMAGKRFVRAGVAGPVR